MKNGARRMKWTWAGMTLLLAACANAEPMETPYRAGQDAVQVLQAHGLIEGYPDGTFKGDRAMSRWEVAMVIARMLAFAEKKQLDLLSKAELEELRKIARELQPELEGLGVRVTNLEEAVDRLDKRVTEVERIKFSGQVVSSFVSQRIYSTGNGLGGRGPGALNYDAIIGHVAGSNLVPHGATAVVPALDMIRGRPLTSGEGFTSALYLNVATQPSDDVSVDLRLFAFTSQGNSVVDAVWGVTPPYLANSFTGSGAFNAQGLDHTPSTTMGFDRLKVTHIPSGTTLTVGSFNPRVISPQVFSGEVNPKVGDPRFLECFGAHVTGDSGPFMWEVFGTYLPDGNPGTPALNPYRNEAYGGAVCYKEDGWTAGLNFLRAASQSQAGQSLAVGLSNLVNGDTGQVNVNWVNPPEFFSGRLAPDQSAGLGSTSDKRPIPGNPGTDAAGTLGSFGPQDVSLGSFNLEYRTPTWNFGGEMAFSSYKPNRNSAYSSDGRLYRLGGGVSLLDNNLTLDVDYRYTDPTYDPMILAYPGTAAGVAPFRVYHRFPDQDQFWHLYSLHDTDQFAHNRQGFFVNLKYSYADECNVAIRYRNQQQVRTSLQDVRYRANQLGAGTPDVTVLGFAPGFFDAFFREFSRSSFDAALNPLENPRGSVEAWSFELNHQFEESPFSVSLGYDNFHFFRPTSLTAALGGSQNLVDVVQEAGRLRVGYQPQGDWGVGLGYEFGTMRGHYDPLGVYNNYAQSVASVGFRNRDIFQSIPFVDVNWKVADNMKFDADLRYYDSVDRVPTAVFGGPPGGPTSLAHPFSFQGYRLTTRLEYNF